MNLYEVIHWGSHGDGNAEDTIYLVRAPDFLTAVDFVRRNASPVHHNGKRWPVSHAVYEIGIESAAPQEGHEVWILRGPYFSYAYNYGWKSWTRVFKGEDYSDEWEEDKRP